MGFLKELGGFAGKVVGGVIGGGVEAVGTVVDSTFLKEVGQGVYQATVASGEMVGSLADSAVTTVHGIATDDSEKVKEGLGEAGRVVKITATGVGRTISHTASNAGQVVNGVLNNDLESAGHGAKELAKTVLISTLAIGIGDVLLDIGGEPVFAAEVVGDTVETARDIVSYTEVAFLEDVSEGEPNVHQVDPHWVNDYYRADGTHVEGYCRDGDGNTSTNLSTEQGGGYLRSNPTV